MLAEIASNPVAWPLWAVLLFAATMYPLGFMLPGCVCCGTTSSECTTCGIIATGYAEGQNGYGRMCCDGTIAEEVTVRITSTGPSFVNVISRGGLGDAPPSGATSYQKVTRALSCSSWDGDYVMALDRSAQSSPSQNICPFNTYTFYSAPFIRMYPANNSGLSYDTADFPYWKYWLSMFFTGDYRPTVSYQTCSGYPGTESCGSAFDIAWTGGVALWRSGFDWDGPDGSGPVSYGDTIYDTQRCDPSGVLVSNSSRLAMRLVPPSGGGPTEYQYLSGCVIKVEFV